MGPKRPLDISLGISIVFVWSFCETTSTLRHISLPTLGVVLYFVVVVVVLAFFFFSWGEGGGSVDTMEKGDDPYKVLGLSREATIGEIRKAYRGLALIHHPDRQNNEQDKLKAQSLFAKISGAYEILSDETSREEYDRSQEDCDRSQERGQTETTGDEPTPGYDPRKVNVCFNSPYEVWKRDFEQRFGFPYPGAEWDSVDERIGAGTAEGQQPQNDKNNKNAKKKKGKLLVITDGNSSQQTRINHNAAPTAIRRFSTDSQNSSSSSDSGSYRSASESSEDDAPKPQYAKAPTRKSEPNKKEKKKQEHASNNKNKNTNNNDNNKSRKPLFRNPFRKQIKADPTNGNDSNQLVLHDGSNNTSNQLVLHDGRNNSNKNKNNNSSDQLVVHDGRQPQQEQQPQNGKLTDFVPRNAKNGGGGGGKQSDTLSNHTNPSTGQGGASNVNANSGPGGALVVSSGVAGDNRPLRMETTEEKIVHEDNTVETITTTIMERPDGSIEKIKMTDKASKRPEWRKPDQNRKRLTNGDEKKKLPELTNGEKAVDRKRLTTSKPGNNRQERPSNTGATPNTNNARRIAAAPAQQQQERLSLTNGNPRSSNNVAGSVQPVLQLTNGEDTSITRETAGKLNNSKSNAGARALTNGGNQNHANASDDDNCISSSSSSSSSSSLASEAKKTLPSSSTPIILPNTVPMKAASPVSTATTPGSRQNTGIGEGQSRNGEDPGKKSFVKPLPTHINQNKDHSENKNDDAPSSSSSSSSSSEEDEDLAPIRSVQSEMGHNTDDVSVITLDMS